MEEKDSVSTSKFWDKDFVVIFFCMRLKWRDQDEISIEIVTSRHIEKRVKKVIWSVIIVFFLAFFSSSLSVDLLPLYLIASPVHTYLPSAISYNDN